MTEDTTQPRRNARIQGTLHARGYAHPSAREDVDLPKEKAEESEVAGMDENGGRKDEGAR